VSNAVSFSGGFVLSGVLMVKKGYQSSSGWGGGGCAGGGQSADLSLYQSALWWSADGRTWTRDTLNGTTSSYSGVAMYVVRLDDNMLVAEEWISDTLLEWASTDGKTWTGLKGAPIPTNVAILAGKNMSLIEGCNGDTAANAPMCFFNGKFPPAALNQTGDLPWGDQLVLGPSGLLATDKGQRFWIGVPTAG